MWLEWLASWIFCHPREGLHESYLENLKSNGFILNTITPKIYTGLKGIGFI